MTALVIGASGLVGGALLDALAEADVDAVGTYAGHARPGLRALDVRDAAAVRALADDTAAQVIYVPASLTNVDYCEMHPDESYAINVAGVHNIVATGRRVVYFSSDYVFAGDSGPYRESDPVHPLCVYGEHKLQAERAVPADGLIVRTTVVYGPEWQGKNFIYRLCTTLRAGQRLRVPHDQIGSPTYAPNLARAAVALERADRSGIYHVAGPERASRYEFALAAAEIFGLDRHLIDPISTSELRQAARRPLDAGMISDKAAAQLQFPLVGYLEGLRLFRDVLGKQRSVEGSASALPGIAEAMPSERERG
jgi:dTDP-4-dehydrorhamnose reductase